MPLGEREAPSGWPGWAKAWFEVGRGTAVAGQGLYEVGRGAVEHPTRVPGAVWQRGEDTVADPLGAGKALIGYDELAAGRYWDWLGQAGTGALLGGAGAGAGRAARVGRVRGRPRIEPVKPPELPLNHRQFAGGRMDFGRSDLGRRAGTPASTLSAATRAELARDYPRGVRYTRAGYPVLTPYATERVRLHGLTGDRKVDEARANAEVHLEDTPDKYTWHHVEDGRTMELVPKELHKRIGHTGSAGAIKANQLNPVAPGGSLTPFERGPGGAGGAGGLLGGPAASPPPPPGSGR